MTDPLRPSNGRSRRLSAAFSTPGWQPRRALRAARRRGARGTAPGPRACGRRWPRPPAPARPSAGPAACSPAGRPASTRRRSERDARRPSIRRWNGTIGSRVSSFASPLRPSGTGLAEQPHPRAGERRGRALAPPRAPPRARRSAGRGRAGTAPSGCQPQASRSRSGSPATAHVQPLTPRGSSDGSGSVARRHWAQPSNARTSNARPPPPAAIFPIAPACIRPMFSAMNPEVRSPPLPASRSASARAPGRGARRALAHAPRWRTPAPDRRVGLERRARRTRRPRPGSP